MYIWLSVCLWGASIAFSMLHNGELHTENLMLDSGVFVPTIPILLGVYNKTQLSYKNGTKMRNPKTLKQMELMFGKELAPYYTQMADAMSDDNLLAAVNSIGNFHLPQNIKLENTNIIAFHGTVFMEIQAKKSVKYLKKILPLAYIKVFNNYHHGELSVNRPIQFIEEVEKAINTFQ